MIEDIVRFIKVVDVQSFSRAARALYVTRPAVSLSIKRLEKYTQSRLLIRKGKQLVVTEDGKAIYRIGIKIVELWDRAQNPQLRNNRMHMITLGLFDNAALLLASFFQKVFTENSIQVDIKIDNSITLFQELQDGILDCCICVLDSKTKIPKTAELIKEFDEELVPVSANIYQHQDIHLIPFILYKKGSTTRNCIDEIFFKNTIIPTIIAESTSTSFMKELALRGGGVTILPKNFILHELEESKLHVFALPFTIVRKIGIFKSKDIKSTLSNTFLTDLTSHLSSAKTLQSIPHTKNA